MSKIDKWCAEQCGVSTYYMEYNGLKSDYLMWNYPPSEVTMRWTIEDPRCREIVRARFKIKTSYIDVDEWRSVEMKWRRKIPDNTGSYCLSSTGKTIAEAEIACITAIYEQENST